jgi:hypothetical protein
VVTVGEAENEPATPVHRITLHYRRAREWWRLHCALGIITMRQGTAFSNEVICMAKRKVIDVSPSGDAWEVRQRGGERASGRFDKKTDAVDRARELAKNEKPAQVVIRKKDGVIQEERTYGSDPFPPRG